MVVKRIALIFHIYVKVVRQTHLQVMVIEYCWWIPVIECKTVLQCFRLDGPWATGIRNVQKTKTNPHKCHKETTISQPTYKILPFWTKRTITGKWSARIVSFTALSRSICIGGHLSGHLETPCNHIYKLHLFSFNCQLDSWNIISSFINSLIFCWVSELLEKQKWNIFIGVFFECFCPHLVEILKEKNKCHIGHFRHTTWISLSSINTLHPRYILKPDY